MSKREAYEDKLRAQLDEWKAEIDKLEAKAKKATADLKIKYDKQIQELKDDRNSLKYKLSIIHEIGEDEWEEFKEDVDKIQSVLKKELEQLREKFS